MEFTTLCRRTNYPKLGYIIHKLREAGIACRFNGESFHADYILEIDKVREADGWNILSEKHGKYQLDDMRDDHPKFRQYAMVQPVSDFIGGFHRILEASHSKMSDFPFTLADAESTWLSLGIPEPERLAFEAKGYQEGIDQGREFLEAYSEPDNDMRL